MYGNYCGPYWSDGKFQSSVVGTKEPIDEFDATCYRHDAIYAVGGDLEAADFEFARENIGGGLLRTTAGLAVGAQGLGRRGMRKLAPNIKSTPKSLNTNEIMTKSKTSKSNLRGATPKGSTQQKASNGPATSTRSVPAAVGTTMRMVAPKVVRSGNTARITGRDYIGSVPVNTTTNFGIATTCLLSPAYFTSAFLGNLCRSYESYRWQSLRIHYVPACSTATTGSIILASAHSVTQPALSGELSNFLPRALTQGNASMGPLWEHGHIDIDCSKSDWRLVDPTTSVDLDDNIHEELQVYYSAATALTAGYLFAEYVCEFSDPVYQPHSLTIPISFGPGTACILSDNNTVNAIADDWNLRFDSGLSISSIATGTIFRAVLDVVGSAAPAGATLNNLLNSAVFSHSTTTTFGIQTVVCPLVGGQVFYFVVDSATVKVYGTIENARTGIGSGQLVHRTATTDRGTYRMIVTLVGLDPSAMTTIQ